MIDVLTVGMDVGTLMRVASLLGVQGLAVKSRRVTEGELVATLVSQVAAERPKLVIVDLDHRFKESVVDFLREVLGGPERLIVLLLVARGQGDTDLVARAIEIGGMDRVDLRVMPFVDNIFVSQVRGLLRRAGQS